MTRNNQSDTDASRERLESFASAVDGWFWETDAGHKFIYMSDSVETITGVRPEWHYGKSRREIGVPHMVDLEAWHAHLDSLDRHEPFDSFVFARRAPDGVKWMQTTGRPVFDAAGNFKGYRGVASDITARIEAEHRTETLANAVEQLSEMFVLWGPDDRLILCNKRFREINARTIETTEPGTLFETHIRAGLAQGLYPDARGREEDWLAERIGWHRDPKGTFEMERQDGRWLLINEQRLPNGSTLTISSDITEMKRSQAAAAEQTNIIETSLRAMPDGMVVLDKNLEFISWNDRLFEILELDRAPIVEADSPAKAYRHMMAARGEYGPGNPEERVAEHEAMIRNSGPAVWEQQLSTGRWVEIRSYPIPSGGYIAIFRDFTGQRAVARMKDEFISTVSHELRTPLTSILGSLGLLANGAVEGIPPKGTELLKIAHNNGARLLDLINDLLDLERLASGQMEYRMEDLSVSVLLEEAVAAHQGYADQYGVTLKISSTCDREAVLGDRARLLQVMANLLSNATKYSDPGGEVEITAAPNGDAVRISVINHGPGIPEEYHPRLFDKFTQADASDTRRKGGTGLGLSICKAIVEHHGGEIGFETKPGEGTTFNVDLSLRR